jgi:broad specificity phosphatase PhoE
MKTKLILVRHGETSTNTEGKIHKYSDPEELTSNGVLQIRKTADALNKYHPYAVYCSKEKRALQSAKVISKELNIPLLETNGLEERNWGDYAGLTFQEIKQKAGMDNMTFEERYTFHPPHGESWKETEGRLLKTLGEILSKNKGKTVVLVTHGGSIRIYMPTLLGVNKEESYKYDPDNASISVFDYVNGVYSKVIYNDTSHLGD